MWPGRVWSPQCWLWTHSPALPAAEEQLRNGTGHSEMGSIIVVLPRCLNSCDSDTCVCWRDFCISCGMCLPTKSSLGCLWLSHCAACLNLTWQKELIKATKWNPGMVWFGRSLEVHLISTPCSGQRHFPLDQGYLPLDQHSKQGEKKFPLCFLFVEVIEVSVSSPALSCWGVHGVPAPLTTPVLFLPSLSTRHWPTSC